MISASSNRAFAALTRSLTAKAAALGTAHGERIALQKRDDPRRWRRARLLWPLFVKG